MHHIIENILSKHKGKDVNTILLLQETQKVFGYIPKQAIDYYSENLSIAPSRFYGVATFYSQFRLMPAGKYKITACCGTACHVKGAERLINNLKRELNLTGELDTTDDMQFTLEEVACVGACSIAPVFVIDEKLQGKMTSKKISRKIKMLKESKSE